MTDEERARIWAETRAESERLLSQPAFSNPPPDKQPAYEPPPIEFEHPDDKWRREADEQERRFEAARAKRKREEAEAERARARATQADWNAWCDRRIADALAIERERYEMRERAIIEAIGERVGQYSRDQERRITELRALLDQLRTHDDQHRVIDMPSPLRPRSVN